MNYLPLATDFRAALRAAQTSQEPGDRLEKLAALAGFRLGYVETIQLEKALGSTAAASHPGFVPLRLAVLSSSTVDHLIGGIRVAGLRRRLLVETYLGQYGQFRQE